MNIIAKRKYEDKGIDRKIRKYGVNKLANEIGVSNTYISFGLRGYPISERIYLKIKECLNKSYAKSKVQKAKREI
ncbi:MAG: hypothetical protein ACFFDH_00295 [Promethearchaeota archaeon]